MKIGSYTIKKSGKPATFDHDQIKALILAGKKNPEIAEIVGCSRGHVCNLRSRWRLKA